MKKRNRGRVEKDARMCIFLVFTMKKNAMMPFDFVGKALSMKYMGILYA